MKHKLSRRTILRGLCAGSAVGVSVPLLDAMLNEQGDPLPRRYGVWFFAGGVENGWAPDSTGSLTLPEQLSPLAPFQDSITTIGGLKCPSFGDYSTNRHIMGTAGGLSGHRPNSGAFSGKSFDQTIADELSGNPLHSLQLGVYPQGTAESGTGWDWISHTGANSPNPAEFDPATLYATLFSGGFGDEVPAGTPNHDSAIRRSYLDAVKADAVALQQRLGSHDRVRMEAFLDGLSEIENQLRATDTPKMTGAACSDPGAPQEGDPEATNRAMAKILATALACQKTQTFAFQYTRPNAFIQYPGFSDSHHNLGHTPQQSAINESTQYTMSQFAVLLEELNALPEGDGTLLDNCAVLVQSDTSWDHSLDDMVAIVAGKAGGALRGNTQARASGPVSRAALTLGRACGADLASLGTADGTATESINEILA